VGLYNGDGYSKAEANDQKAVQIRGTLRPLPMHAVLRGWRITGFYDADHYVAHAARRRAILDTTFEHHYVNVGFGRLEPSGVPEARAAFIEYLRRQGRIATDFSSCKWHGHAYLVSGSPGRRVVDDGVMLLGDAAGLAYPRSGEGIRPAIESGLIAASTIVGAQGDYRRERLSPYARKLHRRFGAGSGMHLLSHLLPAGTPAALGVLLLGREWFVRHVVLDRWFLHADAAPLGTRLTGASASLSTREPDARPAPPGSAALRDPPAPRRGNG
jgi:2-polyprenyl-6-methoxyphenol hydroxylase-like FAD-dependent oxidoreductase